MVTLLFQILILRLRGRSVFLYRCLDHLDHDLGFLKLAGDFSIKRIKIRQAPAHQFTILNDLRQVMH